MKQKLLNSLRLQLCTIVACLLCAFNGQAWGQTVLLSEDFSSIKAGNSTTTSGSTSKWDGNENFPSTNNLNAYQAGGAVKIGSSKQYGRLTSKTLDVSAGTLTVAFDVKGWSSIEGSIKVSVGSLNNTISYTTTMSESFESKSVNFNISEAGQITVKLETTEKRAFLDNIVITNTASSTPTCAVPSFSPAAGTFTSAQEVTISTTTDGATIYYTTDGTEPTTSSSVYSSAISVSETTTIKAIAVKADYNNSSVATAEYNIIDPNRPGTENKPYTVAQARAAIDANEGLTNVYATGIVSEIVTEYNSQYGNISYNISADGSTSSDQLQAYRGKSFNGENFTSADDIQVGDVVVIYGTLKKHNSTYEFDANNQLVSLNRPVQEVAKPVFSAESGIFDEAQTITITCETSGATIYYTTDGTEPTNASTQYSNDITISSNTVLKAIAYKGESHSLVATASYCFPETKTVAEALAIINALENGATTEWDYYVSGIVSTAAAEAPNNGALTYFISDDGETTTQLEVFKGKGLNSADFTTATDLQVGDIVTVCGKLQKYVKDSNVTPEIASGNFLKSFERPTTPVDNPTITLGNHENISFELFWWDLDNNDYVILNDGDNVEPGTEVFIVPTVADGYTLDQISVTANGNSIDISKSGYGEYSGYTFTMPTYNVTINATATESSVTPVTGDKYVKVESTNDLTSGQYLIVYEEGSLAFNGGLEALDAVGNTIEVVLNNSEIAVTDETAAAEFTIDVTAGTIKSASGYYIGQTSNANGLASNTETAYTNTISFTDGNANIISSGAYLRYNSASNQLRFRYYKSSSYTGQKAIQLYKKVEDTPEPETITVTISSVGLSTLYYGTKNLIVPEGVEAYTVAVASSPKLTRSTTYSNGNIIPAGTGVVLEATQGTYEFTVTSETPQKDASNLLRGSDEDVTTEGGQYYYALTLDKNGANPGFYWMNKTGEAFTNRAHKAYMALNSKFSDLANGNTAGGVKGFLALPEADADAIENLNLNVNENSTIYNVAGQRVGKMTKGIYVVNGKKVIVK